MKQVLSTAFMALSMACSAIAIPYAEESEIVGQSGVAEPGALQWHRDSSGAPFLSVGTFEGSRDAVRDRDALHRVPYVAIQPPDYSIALGDGVTMSNGWFVLWSGEVTGEKPQVREISLTAAAGWEIVAVAVTNIRPDAAQVVFDGGEAKVRCRQARYPPLPGFESKTDCAFGIVRVLAVDSITSKERDNLTMGDYLFTDTVGDCSLGTLREWANQQHANKLADSWSKYRATEQVWFADQRIVFDSFGRFNTGIRSGTNTADTLTLYAGGVPAIDIVSDVIATNSAFRIVDFSVDNSVTMDVTAIGTNVTVLAVANLLDTPLVWTEESGVSVDYTPRSVGGVDCYRVTFPRVAGMRFWKARTTIGASSSAAVRFNVPVILTAPNGSHWRLNVSDNGTLSTEAAD